MFEVGKLTDESLDSFLGELEKASLSVLRIRTQENKIFATKNLVLTSVESSG